MKGFILGFLVATALAGTFIAVSDPDKKIGMSCDTVKGSAKIKNYVSLYHVEFLKGNRKGDIGVVPEDKVFSCSPLP